MSRSHMHRTHPEIIKRLKRADGHMRAIIGMIEEGRPCLDVAQQLLAVERALALARRTFIQDHLDHCLEAAVGPLERAQRKPLKEFKEIIKYL
ncbi:MAG: metal-sensing transcriptional repressor [Hyphomicrobium sp.]|nr:metal-sensing transcriptional repressor [Hyphomicrobium sp.]MBN9276874.1 metal-sensing transcriptional repressor [Hyphomicrobium sp.]